jgi:hypothetical protein
MQLANSIDVRARRSLETAPRHVEKQSCKPPANIELLQMSFGKNTDCPGMLTEVIFIRPAFGFHSMEISVVSRPILSASDKA